MQQSANKKDEGQFTNVEGVYYQVPDGDSVPSTPTDAKGGYCVCYTVFVIKMPVLSSLHTQKCPDIAAMFFITCVK